MIITLDEFVEKYSGKEIDFDGQYGGQCVDLYRQYVKEVLDFPQSPSVQGAKDIWNSYLEDKYLRITNTSDLVPQRGDVVIWNGKVGSGYGHIGVFIEGDINRFTSFDQNWKTLSVCEVVEHNYNCVIGILRPVKLNCDKERLERDRNWNLYQESERKQNQLKAEIDSLSSKINSQKQEYEAALVTMKEEAVVLQNRVNELETELISQSQQKADFEPFKKLVDAISSIFNK